MKLLIMGLPGAGKTTFAQMLVDKIRKPVVHLNADEIRSRVNKGLGFGMEGRLEQARRMGAMMDIISRSGVHVIADFVCPTPETRAEFGKEAGRNVSVVFMDTVQESRFVDTNQMFIPLSEREREYLRGDWWHYYDWKYDIANVKRAFNV
jgi:adenylylsulfate kinase